MTQFEILFDAIDLKRHGRNNAAKSQFESLDHKFRMAVLAWVTERLVNQDLLQEVEQVDINTPYGLLVLTNKTISDLRTFVPKLI